MRSGGITLLYILAVFSLASCRTSKNTEQQVNRDYSADFLRLSRGFDSLRAGFRLSQQQVTDKLSNLKVENTTTYYTLPDSAGKQYPVYVSTTKADKNEETTERVFTEMEATVRRLSEKVDSLSARVDEALKKEQKVAEVSWWERHKWRVLVPVVLVIIVMAFVYKLRKK